MKLRIEKAIYGGDGLARIPAGKTVFVPGTLPGELVEATITTDRRSFATGKVDAILEPSAERVTPGCEYFPRCGGCQYQHAGPAFQLQMKLDILKETLGRAHVPIPSEVPSEIASLSGPAWGYRNRIRLQVKGRRLGYLQRASHTLLPVTHCPIAAPVLEQAIAVVERVAGLEGLCEEVEFFTNGEQDQLLISLWPGSLQRPKQKPPEQALEAFAERVRLELPALIGVGLFTQQNMKYWGQRSLTYTVCGVPYQVSLGSFFQVNRFLLPELVQLVVKNRSGRMAWDLYAGAGLFARALEFDFVTAVESEGFSSDDLNKNLESRPHQVVRSNTLAFLRSQSSTEERPDLIVVDPPRAGLGKEVCGHLSRIAAPNIIYVSCDPATLARDLQTLLESGYFLQTIQLVDMFPQTFHLETVTVLVRA
jgi:23S rRNA (uracil1939-C5)-methyltransferase